MSSLKQKIREKIDELESENDRILQGVNEDCQLPDSQAQAILRSSYHNNGSIQGLKDALGLLDEATKQVLLFQKEAFKEFTKNPNAHDRYYAGKIDAYTEVLAVLEGAEQK